MRPKRKSAAKKGITQLATTQTCQSEPAAQTTSSLACPIARPHATSSALSTRLCEAGRRCVELDEAMTIAIAFLESMSIDSVNFTEANLETNAGVFSSLCARQLILEKVRLELVSRKLCPITLQSLSTVFAMSYCSMSLCLPL